MDQEKGARNEPMTYALIGCGKVAIKHLKAVKRFSQNFKLSALVDNNKEAVIRLLNTMGYSSEQQAAIRIYADFKEMLSREKPQVVAITTPSGSHYALGMAALAAGAHLIMEKPLTLSLSEADALLQAAAKQRLQIAVGHIYRYFPLVSTLAAEISAGKHGRVLFGDVTVRWGHDQAYYDQAAWRGTYAQDGGAVMNQSIHALDLMTFLMGSNIASARADIARLQHRMEAEDFGLAALRLGNGSYLNFEGTTVTNPMRQEASFQVFTEKTEIRGGILAGKAKLEIRDRTGKNHTFTYLRRLLAARWRDGGLNSLRTLPHPHTELYRDFGRALAAGAAPLADGKSGRDALEAVLLIYKAATTGCEANLPLGSFQIENMKNYFD